MYCNTFYLKGESILLVYVARIWIPKIRLNDREMNIHYLGQEGDWDSEWGDGEKFIWITKEKRIVLPPGTQLVLTPTLGKKSLHFIDLHHSIAY